MSILSLDSILCSGCFACYETCPVSAIEIKCNDKGFLYPIINRNRCIECEKCITACQCYNENNIYVKKENGFPVAYGVVHRKPEVRLSSQSGGLFAGLAEVALSMHGVVYGASVTKDLYVKHLRIEALHELNMLQRSKYVQSNVTGTFYDVMSSLLKNRIVLYSGTSCHIAGLILFLKHKKVQTDTLITCDLICHGVPSPLIYKENLLFIEKQYNSQIIEVNFRNKLKFGWHSHVESYLLSDNRVLDLSYYTKLFYSHVLLRDCCFNCQFYNINAKPSDITMGDFWGIEQINANFYNDNKGISLAVIHSNKGMELFKNAKLDIFKVPTDRALEKNIKKPSYRPKYYQRFWKDYHNRGYEYCLRKYTIYGGVLSAIRRKILRCLRIW